jgi:hypothetical protein
MYCILLFDKNYCSIKPKDDLMKLKSVSLPKKIIAIFLILVIFLIAIYSGLRFITPDRFAYPKQDHFHFRLQYIYRGDAENFGTAKYQVDYLKDVCNGELTESPIHFHDNKNQIVHLHWQGITGGDVLKFYGLNKTGGFDDLMGFKMDKLFSWPPKISKIPVYSRLLPKAINDDKYFVYIGEKEKYQKKDFNDFVNKSLESFLGQDSKLRKQKEEVEALEKKTGFNFNNKVNLFEGVKVQAHEGEEHATLTEAEQHEKDVKKLKEEQVLIDKKNNFALQSTTSTSQSQVSETKKIDPQKTDEELKEINNLIGNVIIFVQPNEPTNEQINERFNQLEPLGLSACGG